MADASVEVEFVDNVSGPAKRAGDALKRLQGSAGRLGGAAGKAGGFFDELGGSLLGNLTVANLAADAIKRAASAVVEMGKAAAMSVGKAVLFRESLEFSLEKFLGDSKKARSAMDAIAEVANGLGLDFQTAGTEFKNFVSAGATEMEALDLIRWKADLLAIGDGSQEMTQRVGEAFKQIEKAMATGKIELDAYASILNQLPVTQLQVMEKLAPKIGKKTSDLIDQYGKLKVEMTKLPVKELLEAFREATLEATGMGKAGDLAMQKIKETSAGMVAFLKARFGNIPDDLAGAMDKGSDVAKPFLSKMVDAFDSPAYHTAIDAVAGGILAIVEAVASMGEGFMDGFGAAGDIVGPIGDAISAILPGLADSSGAFKAIGAALGFVLRVAALVIGTMYKLTGVLLTISGALWGAIGAVVTFVGELFGLIDAADGSTSALGTAAGAVGGFFSALADGVADTAGDVGGFFVWLGEQLASFVPSDAAIISWVQALPGQIIGFLQALPGMLMSLGSQMIAGLVSAITGGGAAVGSAIMGVVDSAIAAAKSALGIASPSKLFEDIGFNVTAGLEQGIVGGSPRVSAATAGIVDPSAIAALGPGGNVSNLSANTSATINVQGAGDPSDVAIRVRDVLLDELAGTFEQLNIEVSG